MNIRHLCTTIAAFALLATPALHGVVVASYDFTIDNSNQATSTLATANNMAAPWAVNFMGNVFTGAFRDTDNNLIMNNLADALATNRYVHFTLTPVEAINLLSFQVTLGGTNSATTTDYTVGLGVYSSLTGFTAGNELGTDSLFIPRSSGVLDKATPLTIDLSGVTALQNVAAPVEFRIYYIDDRASAHSAFNVRVRDISVEAAAVPEPAAMALGLGVLALLLALRRRLA